MKSARRKKPYKVVRLTHNDFIDLKKIHADQIVIPTIDDDSEKIQWLKTKSIRITKEPLGRILLKQCHDEPYKDKLTLGAVGYLRLKCNPIKWASDACDERNLFWMRVAPKARFHENHNDPHSKLTNYEITKNLGIFSFQMHEKKHKLHYAYLRACYTSPCGTTLSCYNLPHARHLKIFHTAACGSNALIYLDRVDNLPAESNSILNLIQMHREKVKMQEKKLRCKRTP
uniref:Uncharacterized protein n=1 Tax=Romanomermis culicivorax TaxID=13658 RepID=A0A915KY88_ROMCU